MARRFIGRSALFVAVYLVALPPSCTSKAPADASAEGGATVARINDAGTKDAGRVPLSPATGGAGADAGAEKDAGASLTGDAGAEEPDPGDVLPRSNVVVAEWTVLGGGPRHPVPDGYDFSQRVFADGRVEMRDDEELVSTKDMRFETRKVPKIYRPQHQLTRVEMKQLDALLRRTVKDLAPSYQERSTDRGFYRFEFFVDGKRVKSELSGHADPKASPLGAFLHDFARIHKERRTVKEVLRAWTAEGVVEVTVGCSAGTVDSLRSVVVTMFPHTARQASRPPKKRPPPGTQLLEVRYFEDGRELETYRVTAEGKATTVDTRGKVAGSAELTAKELDALLVALEDVDWKGTFRCP